MPFYPSSFDPGNSGLVQILLKVYDFSNSIFSNFPCAYQHLRTLSELRPSSQTEWSPPPSATHSYEWTTPVLRGPGHLTVATQELRVRKPKGTLVISPVSFSRLPEVGTPCGHVYAVRRRPPVTYVVLEVFEVRVRRAESRGREPGEPEAERPKGGCLQDTPDITNAFSGPATQ